MSPLLSFIPTTKSSMKHKNHTTSFICCPVPTLLFPWDPLTLCFLTVVVVMVWRSVPALCGGSVDVLNKVGGATFPVDPK